MTLGPDTLPEGSRGKLLALGLLLCAAGLVWVAVVSPLIGWYQARSDALADRGALLAHMTQLAAALPSLRNAANTSDTSETESVLLDGDSDAIAGATLQGMVQDMAASAGAPLTSAEALPGEQQGAFRRIGLRVALGASWPVLIGLVREIESSHLRLMVDDVQVHATARTGSAAAAAPRLEASFVVMGFRAGKAPPQRPDLRAQADRQG